MLNHKEINDIAKEVFKVEANSLQEVSDRLDQSFAELAIKIAETTAKNGKLIVSGIGKSGLIGKKVSATLASTGTPSFFVHSTEAFHGDLGMIQPNDIVMLISYSGETDDVLRMLDYLKAHSITTISITGNSISTLAKNTDYTINVKVSKEACPLRLAPTSSTTATLALGDALAVALMKINKFKEADFAKFHPGGSLGRKLLLKAEQLMRVDRLPIANKDTSMIDIISIIAAGRLGLAVIIENQKIVGIITDGDIRRAITKHQDQVLQQRVNDIMTTSPKIVTPDTSLSSLEAVFVEHKVASVLVAEELQLKGVIQIYDIEKS